MKKEFHSFKLYFFKHYSFLLLLLLCYIRILAVHVCWSVLLGMSCRFFVAIDIAYPSTMIATAKYTVISPDFLMWKFCGKAKFPHSFGRFARNYVESVPSRKISTSGNQVKLRYFLQWVTSADTWILLILLSAVFVLI